MSLTDQEEFQLETHRLGNASNVYGLGLDTGVVSFYSQQCRAFDLARLFADDCDVETFQRRRIGVIGGGVGGTTLWAALQAYGFKDVTLFEASDEILSRQASASHRHAHPAINDWPQFGKKREFSSTTKWPFLNWFGTDAASVVRQMRDDPYIKELRTAMPERVQTRHLAVNISEDSEANTQNFPPVTVTFQTQGENLSTYFDTVFLAVGYDYEVNLDRSASNSYWWPDNVREYLWDRHEYGGYKFLISGTGDGGLIDLIRLAEKPDLEGEHANVAMEVVAHLRDTSYQNFDDEWKCEASTSEEAFINAIDSAPLKQHEIQRMFHGLFHDDSFRKYFADDADLKRITLLARTGEFLQGKASTVNKVLVAYLASRFTDLVQTGLVTDEGRPSHVKADGDISGPLHTDQDFKKVVVFTRHGAKSRADKIRGVAELRGREPPIGTDTGDVVNFDTNAVFDGLRKSHGRSAKDDAWAYLETLVAQYLETFFDDASFTVSGNRDNVRIDIQVPLTEENKSAYKRLGGFDRELFGIDLFYNAAGGGLDLTTDTMGAPGV